MIYQLHQGALTNKNNMDHAENLDPPDVKTQIKTKMDSFHCCYLKMGKNA